MAHRYSPSHHHDNHFGAMHRNKQYDGAYWRPTSPSRNSHSMSNGLNPFDQSRGERMSSNINSDAAAPSRGPSPCDLKALEASSLDREVIDMTIELFQQDHDLELSYISPGSIRFLEEISVVEQKTAIREFVERFKKAKHKITKSRSGYFRGVCQKYWKHNIERKTDELLQRACTESLNDQGSARNNKGGLSPLITEAIELLFTPASGLETTIIDESIEERIASISVPNGSCPVYTPLLWHSVFLNHVTNAL